jgi:hypothetical protein
LNITRIYVEELADPIGKYMVRKDGPTGPVLLTASRQPLLDACRALRGLATGRIELWDASRPYPRLSVDIDKGARLTAMEDPDHGPRFAKFIPFKRKENIYAKGA